MRLLTEVRVGCNKMGLCLCPGGPEAEPLITLMGSAGRVLLKLKLKLFSCAFTVLQYA